MLVYCAPAGDAAAHETGGPPLATAAHTAPFPWHGGKRRWASLIWSKLGNPTVYAEPFAGSLAVLLHRRQPCPREIVCDLDGLLCNFWRALRDDPDAVAYWAAWPTIHHDLTARHHWLREWRDNHGHRITRDPTFYDARIAGWWVWGLSNWIGGGWCTAGKYHNSDARPDIADRPSGVQPQRSRDQIPKIPASDGQRGWSGVQPQRARDVAQAPHDKRPHVMDRDSGRGVTAQRVPDKRPGNLSHQMGASGSGVQAQKLDEWSPSLTKRPAISARWDGRGVQSSRQLSDAQKLDEWHDSRPHVGGRDPGQGVQARQSRGTGDILDGSRWTPWFRSLARRLERVVVLNRSWESALTPTLLQHTPTGPKPPVGIFLDPPYLTSDRDHTLYHGDEHADETATKAYEWAIEHGERYRVAYACGAAHFDVPAGWTAETLTFGGINDGARRATQRDMVMFSPACTGQLPLL